jgi:DNA-binding transcriptional LysR family regulator
MLDWENLRHLSALAKGGSLSAAARLLSVEHATVARRIAALEAELGVRVVDRRGRKLLLTAEGDRLAAIADRMEREAMAAERLAASSRQGVAGTVTLSAPPAYAAAALIEPLARLQREQPDLTIEMIGEVRKASLERREADLAVRLDRPRDGNLSIVRLGKIAFRLYASPQYLATTSPANWSFIGYGDELMRDTPQSRHLNLLREGRPMRFLTNTVEIQLSAARAGAGVALLPDFVVNNEAGLVLADDHTPALKREIWLVVHTDVRTAPAVRAVVDALKAAHQLD